MTEKTIREWWPDAAVGVLVLVLGLAELVYIDGFGVDKRPLVLIVLGFAAACGLCRRQPAVALTIIWLTGLFQLFSDSPVLMTEAAAAIVAFGAARWGRVPTVILSGLSIPAAAVVVLGNVTSDSLRLLGGIERSDRLLEAAHQLSDAWQVGAALLGSLALAAPWLLGLVMRFIDRARRSQAQTEQAEADVVRAQVAADQAREIARLQEGQARLARDVHDVVGHSLAVILAQAESGQFLADDDPAALKKTLATIAGSARSSLQDVRQVLAQEGDAVPARTGAFEELVDGVRAGGHEVRVTDVGQARVMAPELDVAAHRVVQEMLTNAIKHGRKDRPVQVERHWPEGSWDRDLRIEVRNIEAYASDETQPLQAGGPPGQGLEGMRRRLESVGGRLDVRRRDEDGEPTFTATAWLPVSGR